MWTPQFWVAVLTVVNICGLIAFTVGQFRNGKVKSNSDEIATANTTIGLLKSSLDVMEKNLAEEKSLRLQDHDELVRVQEQLKHSKEKNGELMAILQNRNPELESLLKLLQTSVDKLNNFLEKQTTNT